MTDQSTFMDRQRDAALAEIRRISQRDRAVADIILGVDRVSRYRIGEVVAIEDGDGATTGAFAAEVETPTLGTIWQVVNDGRRGSVGFRTRPMAILCLMSLRYGDGNAAATLFAARVLGIDDGEQ